jgi:hypothetical protein
MHKEPLFYGFALQDFKTIKGGLSASELTAHCLTAASLTGGIVVAVVRRIGRARSFNVSEILRKNPIWCQCINERTDRSDVASPIAGEIRPCCEARIVAATATLPLLRRRSFMIWVRTQNAFT